MNTFEREAVDRKVGSWFENQVKLYQKKLRKPRKND